MKTLNEVVVSTDHYGKSVSLSESFGECFIRISNGEIELTKRLSEGDARAMIYFLQTQFLMKDRRNH